MNPERQASWPFILLRRLALSEFCVQSTIVFDSFMNPRCPCRRRTPRIGPSGHRATVRACLWINRFMLCSGQHGNATSQPRHTAAREAEGRTVWLREFVGAKHRTHQANVVVIRSDEE